MKKLIYILAGFLIISITACSNGSSDSSEPEYTFEFAADFMHQAVKKCHPKMKEVWPGDDVLKEENFNLILVDAKTNPNNMNICLITPNEKTKITDKTELELALENIQGANFYPVQYNGKKSMMIDMTFTEEEIAMRKQFGLPTSPEARCYERLDLFYHESFHEYVQELATPKWGSPDSKDRDQLWPIDFKPRTYRVLCNLALLEAWDNQNRKNELYSRAKYWLNRYVSEYQKEASTIKITDISEGTANYFGKNVVHSVYSNYEAFERPDGLMLATKIDGESYNLGSLSICLLKRDGKLNDAVKSFTKDGDTPVNLLLKDVIETQAYDGNTAEKATIDKITNAQKSAFSPDGERADKINKIIKDYKDGGKTYLLAESDTSSSDSYSLKELSGFICFLDLILSTEYVDVNGITALQTEFKIPSDNNAVSYYLLPVDSVTFTDEGSYDKSITINTDTVSGVIKGKITSISPITDVDVTIKEPAKTKTCYKVSYKPDGVSKANTFYIIPKKTQVNQ